MRRSAGDADEWKGGRIYDSGAGRTYWVGLRSLLRERAAADEA